MDLILRIADECVLDSVWAHYIPRQLLSLTVIALVGIHLLYFTFAGFSFQFIYSHELMQHPRFFKNQIRFEIQTSLKSFFATTPLTVPWFQAEVMGYSRLYDDVSEYRWLYFAFSILLCCLVYCAHRALHHPMLYKPFHKPHHKLMGGIASHASHPVDGYLHSIPYHLFVFLFPLHRGLYLSPFVLINLWTVFIHDSDMITGHPLEHIINGPSHHTLHHLRFTVNYGQYFTWVDRAADSYRHPEPHLDPLLEVAKEKTL
ncbi:fatty acid hydroxylase [Imleria badia]|nr:fatty acid hydroxylase [Imleria badia]